MRKHLIGVVAAAVLGVTAASVGAFADEDWALPEVLVPFDELDVLLENAPRRVLLSRAEYEALVAQATMPPDEAAPQGAALIAAEYTAELEPQRATIAGALTIDVLEEGMHAVPLPLAGVGLRRAVLDEADAPIGRGPDGHLVVFVEGVGRHRLALDLVAPVATDSARQTLTLQVPTPAATRMTLLVPGDVEVESTAGGAVASRDVEIGDTGETTTRLEILTTPGNAPVSVTMTLNSHLGRSQRSVAARSVIVSEVTQAHEKLYAAISMDVLHQPVDQFRFEVPSGFELTDVTSPALAAWTLDESDARAVLSVRLREPTAGRVVLHVSAARHGTPAERWRMPTLRPIDVVSSVAVVGLLVEDRLTVRALEADGLTPIDTTVLARAFRPTRANATLVRPIAAYYAPQSTFDLQATFEKPPATLLTTTNLLLTLEETVQQVRGGITLVPREEKRFDFAFSVPYGWHVSRVTAADDTPLPFERFVRADDEADPAEGPTRVRVQLTHGVAPGTEEQFFFHAHATPPGWLDDWETTEITLPAFPIEGAATDNGAIAVATGADLAVQPIVLEGLIPLDDGEKKKFGLAEVATELAYRYQWQPYHGTIAVKRTKPRVTARTFSFLRIEPDTRIAHYEVIYDVQRARTRTLSLLLPPDTPEALDITGLDGVTLKGFVDELVEEDGRSWRRWTATLTEARRGPVRLAIDFQQRIDQATADAETDETLALVRADGVAYQSGLVAIEGSAELDVEIVDHPRRVDVGELVDADYEPGRRLLGAFGFVGDPPAVTIKVARPAVHTPPAAIVERAHLETVISASGVSQTLAHFDLRTKSLFLEIRLPAGATLWSATLDGRPTKPQRDGEHLLLDLPPVGGGLLRRLEVVYEAPVDTFGLLAHAALPAPELLFHSVATAAESSAPPVPVADLTWDVSMPSGYVTIASDGTVFTEQIERPRLAVSRLAEWLLVAAGGTPGPPNFRSVARTTASSAVTEFQESMSVADSPAEEAFRAPARQPRSGRSDEGRSRDAAPKSKPASAGSSMSKKTATRERNLLGVRSLDIDIDRSGPSLHFHSFGETPTLDLTLADARRLEFFAAVTGLLVLIIGMARGRTWRGQLRFVFIVGVVTTALAVITGRADVTHVANAGFYAAALLVPILLVLAGLRWFSAWLRAVRTPAAPGATGAPSGAAVSTMLTMALLVGGAPARASGEDGPPVIVPDDVIIVPYVSESAEGDPIVPRLEPGAADRLLVPYGRYIDLWNRAHPDRKLEIDAPPAPYALAGGVFSAELPSESEIAAMRSDPYLELTGRFEFDVLVDDPVEVPLALGGAVLVTAQLDAAPARLTVARLDSGMLVKANNEQRALLPADATSRALLVLHVIGKSRHHLDLTVRIPLERRGGWRLARAVLPAAPATGLTLKIPDAGTDVRLGSIHDRRTYETTRDGEEIRTAASRDGVFAIDWRPKVSRGEVDLTLRAESDVVLDVREDGLRAVWSVDLAFPRGERDTFSVGMPADFLVERVEGTNVRGWETDDAAAGRTTLNIDLLKLARDREHFTVHLRRDETIGVAAAGIEVHPRPYAFAAPVFDVSGAALQNGTMLIRRSPMLHVRTVETSGVARTDVSEFTATLTGGAPDESPMGIRPYEAYRFVTTPFSLRFEADPVIARVSARLQTILRIAERQRRVESRIVLDVQDRPIHRVRLVVPGDLEIEDVVDPGADGPAEWSLGPRTGDGAERLLSVFLPTGRQGKLALVVRGPLGKTGPVETISLPRFKVLDVSKQRGDIVVQADPAFDVSARDLSGCETVLLKSVRGWLKPDQRAISRLAIHHDSPAYAGHIALAARTPQVSCYTVTNVRVTDRAIEDTILVDFTIRQAGVRSVVLLLPETLSTATFSMPLLRSRTIEPASDRPGWVRVRLELEDEVMGHLRLLVESDRLLTPGIHSAPIPIIETGRTERRYVALENTGRDEAVVAAHPGLEPLSRQQKEWRTVAPIFQGGSTSAFIVRATGAQEPALDFKTTQRRIVQTAGARIGLAHTQLACDANGAYRAQQLYRIDNNTEQHLEIELPDGAELWTVRVAGEPVKPMQEPKSSNRVRIPLVKTAPGDLDYEVVIKYAGRLGALGRFASVTFPLIRTVNINVEVSQARIFVPETHAWFDFGGTMRQVTRAGDFEAGYLSYQTRRVERLVETIRDGNIYAQLRGATNYESLKSEINEYNDRLALVEQSEELQHQQLVNSGALELADRQLARIESEADTEETSDNRVRLKRYWQEQRGTRARNVVQEAFGNFDGEGEPGGRGDARVEANRFNDHWARFGDDDDPADATGPEDDAPRPDGRANKVGRGVRNVQTPRAPEVAQRDVIDKLRRKRDAEKKVQKDADLRYGGDAGGKARRYQQHLQAKGAARVPVPSDLEIVLDEKEESRAVGGISGGIGGGYSRELGGPQDSNGLLTGLQAGLVSLDVELPSRGREYLFTTPRGDVEITARAVSVQWLGSLQRLGFLAVAIGLIVLAHRTARRWAGRVDRRAVVIVMIIGGTVCALAGFLPFAGAAVMLAGAAMAIAMRVSSRASVAAMTGRA